MTFFFIYITLLKRGNWIHTAEKDLKIISLKQEISDLKNKIVLIDEKIQNLRSGKFVDELKNHSFIIPNEKIIKIVNYHKIKSIIESYEKNNLLLSNHESKSYFFHFIWFILILFIFSLFLIILFIQHRKKN